MHGIDDPRTNKVYTAPRGSEFLIKKDGPLFYIQMNNGGVRPEFTQNRFTSHKQAVAELEKYFRNNPKPEPRATTPESRERKAAKAAEEE